MDLTMEVALDHHLRYNHYPPVPHLIPVARSIIDRWREGDHNLDYCIEGLERNGSAVSASQLVEDLHLENFGVGCEDLSLDENHPAYDDRDEPMPTDDGWNDDEPYMGHDGGKAERPRNPNGW